MRDSATVGEERPDAAEVVRRLGGVATWSQIVRHSGEPSIRKAVATQRLRRIGRGTYALPEAPLADVAVARTGGLLSHQSAARHWKLEMLTADSSIHVTLAQHARSMPVRHVSLHYSDVPSADDHGGVTSPARTVVDCAVTLPFGDALALADSALRRGLLDQDVLLKAAADRRGPGRRKVIAVAEAADGRAANPFESGLRAIVIETGLRGFEPQLPIQLPDRTIWVDLGDPERRIALEADSFAFHGTPTALVNDCRRYDDLVRADWLVLRFAHDHVVFEPDWLAATVTETCALRDRPGGRRRALGVGPLASDTAQSPR